jgi:catechol 2,3-dioxygenase-like lactoylglutathione lyase family enzyme
MAALTSITPLVPTGGTLAESLAFYVGEMGFSVVWQSDNMAGIQRDSIAFNLCESTNREWLENSSFSIGTSNLAELYEDYKDIAARIGPLEMKVWGRREFHMILPSGVCFQFFESSDEN